MNQIETNISKNIKELRVASGMKQSELGEKIAYSDKTISKWENGSSVPDIVALGAVADLFGITVDDLIRENAADKLINREKKTVIQSIERHSYALPFGFVRFHHCRNGLRRFLYYKEGRFLAGVCLGDPRFGLSLR